MAKSNLKKRKAEFLEEMLQEVKNLKDLAKEELPVVAKEYILANKVQAYSGLAIALVLLSVAAFSGHQLMTLELERYSDAKFGYALLGGLTGIIGFILAMCNVSSLLDLYLQPRRMAIKAITSLKD